MRREFKSIAFYAAAPRSGSREQDVKATISVNDYAFIGRAARHECGHYVAARILGLRTGAMTLVIGNEYGTHEGNAEIILAQPLYDVLGVVEYLEKRIVVLYAGAYAETLSNGHIDGGQACDSLTSGPAMRDYDKIRELIQLLRNLEAPKSVTESDQQSDLKTIADTLANKAAQLVLQESKIIEELGSRLALGITEFGRTSALTESELAVIQILVDRFPDSAK